LLTLLSEECLHHTITTDSNLEEAHRATTIIVSAVLVVTFFWVFEGSVSTYRCCSYEIVSATRDSVVFVVPWDSIVIFALSIVIISLTVVIIVPCDSVVIFTLSVVIVILCALG
jgi:hypothetical protein